MDEPGAHDATAAATPRPPGASAAATPRPPGTPAAAAARAAPAAAAPAAPTAPPPQPGPLAQPAAELRAGPDLARWRTRLAALGAGGAHAQQVLRHWVRALPLDAGRRRPEHWFPAALRRALPALQADLARLATLQRRHPGADGGERLLVALADGNLVESVLLPRGGLCVSTQLGCAVGCAFCRTGVDGLQRQLGSAEIVAQVALARTLRPVRKVVFMGMGEPAHNLDAVLEAIELLGTLGEVGHKNLVFSTVGDARVFERLPQGAVKPALALSLHTTDAALRRRLLPRAPRLDPQPLVEQALAYAEATGYPLQLQWTLLAGVNDSDAEMQRLAGWLRGRYAVLNLIPYNPSEGLGFERPDWDHAARLAREMHRRGVLTKLRHSAGQDVDGGCGQLRARAQGPQGAQEQPGARPVSVQRRREPAPGSAAREP